MAHTTGHACDSSLTDFAGNLVLFLGKGKDTANLVIAMNAIAIGAVV